MDTGGTGSRAPSGRAADGPRRSTSHGHRFQRLSSTTLSSRIARELVRSIVEGHFASGDLLPTEGQLAVEFGASRSVVREAIKSVTMLGLLESRQGRGTLVTPLEEWNHFAPELLEARRELNVVDQFLLDLLEVRRMIEVEAAALAARRATERDLETMRQLAADMERASDDVESFARLDVAFHEAILAAAKNLPLLQLLRLIQPVLLTARIVSLRTGADRVKRSIREHGKVLQGIEGSDPDAARRAMATHLSWTARVSLGGGSSLVVGSTARSARKGRGTDGSQGNAANTER